MRKALSKAGMASHHISGHSFRIGAAMAATRGGATDTEIKAFEWWRSREYKGTFEGTATCRHLWQGNWSGDQEQVAVKDKTCSYNHVCGA